MHERRIHDDYKNDKVLERLVRQDRELPIREQAQHLYRCSNGGIASRFEVIRLLGGAAMLYFCHECGRYFRKGVEVVPDDEKDCGNVYECVDHREEDGQDVEDG